MKQFNKEQQNNLAEQFRKLHYGDDILILPNAWDCTSAKIFENAGFPAIATTSSGISWSCGYQDVEHIPPELMLEVINRITNVIAVPLTADIEGGYFRDNPAEFESFIEGTIKAGAVGINLEDGDGKERKLHDLESQIELIEIVNRVKKKTGVNIYLNARTDGMALGEGDEEQKIALCIERAEAFKRAGADGIFIPFVSDIESVRKLKKEITLPLNILASKTLKIKDLKELKVNRMSVGSKPVLATLGLLKKIATELKEKKEDIAFYSETPDYGSINKQF